MSASPTIRPPDVRVQIVDSPSRGFRVIDDIDAGRACAAAPPVRLASRVGSRRTIIYLSRDAGRLPDLRALGRFTAREAAALIVGVRRTAASRLARRPRG